jgi:ribosomal protein L13
MFEKVIVIDARAHLLGRLASVVAKQLLNGKALSLRWRPLSSPSSR